MANLVLSDVKFPVGASVDAVPFAAGVCGLPGAGAVVETKVVQADGTVTFTTLTDGKAYVLQAIVNGARQALTIVKASTFTAPPKWSEVVAARQAAW